jgi:hypothetical protein
MNKSERTLVPSYTELVTVGGEWRSNNPRVHAGSGRWTSLMLFDPKLGFAIGVGFDTDNITEDDKRNPNLTQGVPK